MPRRVLVRQIQSDFLRTPLCFATQVFLVPSDDPHLSEYVPAAYMRRGFLTDFHGSAGTALVTKDKAYLWTDSRCVRKG